MLVSLWRCPHTSRQGLNPLPTGAPFQGFSNYTESGPDPSSIEIKLGPHPCSPPHKTHNSQFTTHTSYSLTLLHGAALPPPLFSAQRILAHGNPGATSRTLSSHVLTLSRSHVRIFSPMSPTTHSTTGTRIKPSTRKKLKEQVQEEKQVIVHCHYSCTNPYGMYIRIWPSTYLIARDVQHRSELVHAENIPLAPEWMPVAPGTKSQFTLIFSGLPKDCQRFDLAEIIPQEGGFFVADIERNNLDVYEVEMAE